MGQFSMYFPQLQAFVQNERNLCKNHTISDTHSYITDYNILMKMVKLTNRHKCMHALTSFQSPPPYLEQLKEKIPQNELDILSHLMSENKNAVQPHCKQNS